MKPILLCLASALVSASISAQALDLPAAFGPIDWSYSPADVIASPEEQRAVLWLGLVESVTARAEGDKVTVLWLCKHLSFEDPGPSSISAAPVRFRPSESGYFVVDLVVGVPADAIAALEAQFREAGRYLLAAGHTAGVVDRAGGEAVLLVTEVMTQADDLGTRVSD